MVENKEHLIQKRAYEIWEKHGRPHGHDKAHWDQAARELVHGGATLPGQPAKKAAPKAPVAPKAVGAPKTPAPRKK